MTQPEERLTPQELRHRYPGQWVLLRDVEACEITQLVGGVVAAHHPHRGAVERTAVRLRPGTYALWHSTGIRPLHYVSVAR